jgi:hypothetical protein
MQRTDEVFFNSTLSKKVSIRSDSSKYLPRVHILLTEIHTNLPIMEPQETKHVFRRKIPFNPLNPELNPICHLQVLLGSHYNLHFSRLRANTCT